MHNFNRTCLIFGAVFLMMSCSGGDDSDDNGGGSSSSSSSSSSGGGDGIPYTALANSCGGDNGDKMQTSVTRDGTVVSITMNTYDADGNLLMEEFDGNANGYFSTKHTYTYDANANMLTKIISSYIHELSDVEEWTYDSANNIETYEKRYGDWTYWFKNTYTYNADNEMLTESTDNYNSDSGTTCSVQDCGKGSVDSITTWTYETEGSKRVLTETNTDADGTATTEITWVYEVVDACRAVYEATLSESCGDNDNASLCTESCAWIAHTVTKTAVYHSADMTTTQVSSYKPGGLTMYETSGNSVSRMTYDADGNTLTHEQLENDGSQIWLKIMTYDENDNMTSRTQEMGGVEVIWTWTYDTEGRLIEETTEEASETTTTTYAYTCE